MLFITFFIICPVILLRDCIYTCWPSVTLTALGRSVISTTDQVNDFIFVVFLHNPLNVGRQWCRSIHCPPEASPSSTFRKASEKVEDLVVLRHRLCKIFQLDYTLPEVCDVARKVITLHL